jgi:hypothetical protein
MAPAPKGAAAGRAEAQPPAAPAAEDSGAAPTPARVPTRRAGSGSAPPLRLPGGALRAGSADALSPAERRSRCSAEFVVNLGPPEPLASFASSDQDAAAGAGRGRPAAARPAGSSPKARPDLLASIDDESQLTLRYHRISAFVSTRAGPPSLRDRLKGAAKTMGGGEREPEERQILFSVSGEIMPGEVLALM